MFRAPLASLTGPEDQRHVIGRTAIQHNEITMVFDELYAANFGRGIRIIADRCGTASMVLGSDRRPLGESPDGTQRVLCINIGSHYWATLARRVQRPGTPARRR